MWMIMKLQYGDLPTIHSQRRYILRVKPILIVCTITLHGTAAALIANFAHWFFPEIDQIRIADSQPDCPKRHR